MPSRRLAGRKTHSEKTSPPAPRLKPSVKSSIEVQRLQQRRPASARPSRGSGGIAQLKEAEAAFSRLAGQPRSLCFYLDYALANYREPEKQKKAAGRRRGELHRVEGATSSNRTSFRRRKWGQDSFGPGNGWWPTFPARPPPNSRVAGLVTFLEVGRPGMKTYNNRRGVVSTFLKFAFQRGWLAENPIGKVPHYRIRRKRGVLATTLTLTVAQARALMEHVETCDGGRLVPYFALCLFAGIRPGVPHGEITKLKPDAVNLEAGVIYVTAEVSKVREPRRMTIHPNLAAWLARLPARQIPAGRR